MPASYSDKYSSGDRRSIIDMSLTSPSIFSSSRNDPTKLIDGSSGTDTYFINGLATASIIFNFKVRKRIEAFIFKMSSYLSGSIWVWEGSNDVLSWTIIKTNISFTTLNLEIVMPLPVKSYQYYRLRLTSGTLSSGPWLFEFDFKIDSAWACLVNQNNSYYTINDNQYNQLSKKYAELPINNLPQDINLSGFDIVNITDTKIINGESFRPIDKFDGPFKICVLKK